jgi:hypothetical protein
MSNGTEAPKTAAATWSAERLRLLDRSALQMLRQNAAKRNAEDLVRQCDEELTNRGPAKGQTKRTQVQRSETRVVAGYHFVCDRGRGVTEDGNGQFWSGSWVVAEANVRQSLAYGAYLALHEEKSAPSYRQGMITNFRLRPRDMISKENTGIEFLVRETAVPYAWVGAGAGEKGYLWTDIKKRVNVTADEEPSSS